MKTIALLLALSSPALAFDRDQLLHLETGALLTAVGGEVGEKVLTDDPGLAWGLSFLGTVISAGVWELAGNHDLEDFGLSCAGGAFSLVVFNL
jgi:hypothetical protein